MIGFGWLQVSSARSGVHVCGLIDRGGLVVSDSIIVTMIVDIYVRDWLVYRTQTQEKIQVRDVLRATGFIRIVMEL